VVDQTGIIRIACLQDEYSRRLDPDSIVETLKKLQS
jgi:hypothetical protein